MNTSEPMSTSAEHPGEPPEAHVRQHRVGRADRVHDRVQRALEPEHDRRERVQQEQVPQADAERRVLLEPLLHQERPRTRSA